MTLCVFSFSHSSIYVATLPPIFPIHQSTHIHLSTPFVYLRVPSRLHHQSSTTSLIFPSPVPCTYPFTSLIHLTHLPHSSPHKSVNPSASLEFLPCSQVAGKGREASFSASLVHWAEDSGLGLNVMSHSRGSLKTPVLGYTFSFSLVCHRSFASSLQGPGKRKQRFQSRVTAVHR